MKFNELRRRQAIAGILSALFMVGLFVGRLSIRYSWVEVLCTLIYVVNALIWIWPLYSQAKREAREFKAMMRKLDEEMWR